MKLTLSIDDEVLARACEVAEQRGVSVETLIAEYLKQLMPKMSPEEVIRELKKMWASESWSSDGQKLTREEMHERRGVR